MFIFVCIENIQNRDPKAKVLRRTCRLLHDRIELLSLKQINENYLINFNQICIFTFETQK